LTGSPWPTETERPGRSVLFRAGLGVLGALLCLVFIGLGSWQVQRRAWKLALIAQVEQRVHAAPVAAPGPARWPAVNATDDAYRHVQLSGHYLGAEPTLVQAVTELGSGFWVMAPLQTPDGSVVLVNRGFVPPERRDLARAGLPAGPTTVTGLLRISEPGGAFLRHNDPAAGRWYSRDVAQIARAAGLVRVAPYFIDADAGPGGRASDGPIAGLTVVSFQNNHLVYAITWYTLAAMVAGAAWFVMRSERTNPPR